MKHFLFITTTCPLIASSLTLPPTVSSRGLGMRDLATVVEGRQGPPIARRADTRCPDDNADPLHEELRDRLEQMLLRRIFYDELGGKPEYGSRERLFENKICEAWVRPIAVREGFYQFPTKMEGPYFWPEH